MKISEKTNITVNLGGAEIVTLQKLFEIVYSFMDDNCILLNSETTTGSIDTVPRIRIPAELNDIEHSCADIELARKLFNFNPKMDMFEHRLRKILAYEFRDKLEATITSGPCCSATSSSSAESCSSVEKTRDLKDMLQTSV
jgi:5-methylcytosine-specific restriction endonuclease McrBC regulatory subunit McrC